MNKYWEEWSIEDVLHELFSKIDTCLDSRCGSCSMTKEMIEHVCVLLGIDSDEVMPEYLKKFEGYIDIDE